MNTDKLLFLLILLGLIVGCAADVSISGPAEPSYTSSSSIPSPLPTRTGNVMETVPATEVPETPADRTIPTTFPSVSRRPPPAVEDHSLPAPVEMARTDLAHRLHADISVIEVAEVGSREPDVEAMPCLADLALAAELWESLSEIQWISLSVKGNIHHYAALGELVLYCDEPTVRK